MADNAQKVAIARTLNQWGQRRAAAEIQRQGRALPAQVTAVNGPIVTVKFLIASTTNSPYTLPNVTVPLAGPQWWRPPTQVGDQGFVVPADAYLGGVSGLGGGTADLSQRANLSTLVFFPIGNKNFSASENPNAHVLYGPDGVILRDTGKNSTLTVNQTGITGSGKSEVLFEVGGLTISITPSGGIAITSSAGIFLNGPVVINGIVSGQAGGGGEINFGTATIASVAGITSSADVTAGGISLQTHTHTQGPDSHGDTEEPTSAPVG